MTKPQRPVRLGEPLRHGAVTVFPLFAAPAGKVAYRLAAEALADASVVVREVSEEGSVPEVLLENEGDRRVLLLEGEPLVGARQDRVLNTSVLVPARSRTRLPVSCVEQGRWGYRSRTFGSSSSYAPSGVRAALKSSVTRSLRARRRHASDQFGVWGSVRSLHLSSGVHSETGALEDAYLRYAEELESLREALAYVDGASGLAVGVGDRLLALDLYDRPETCARVWPRLVASAAFDAMVEDGGGAGLARADVEAVLAAARAAAWEEVPAVGEGREWRADVGAHHASALACEGSVVHESVVCG